MKPDSKDRSRVFVIRMTDAKADHALLGYAFVEQAAFVSALNEADSPEIRLALAGLERMFDNAAEVALAAIPFPATRDPNGEGYLIGASVQGASVR